MLLPGTVIAAALLAFPCANGRSTAFPPGWNGLAQTPPLGWRSWNAFGARVSQDIMTATMDAMASKSWTVAGRKNVSLIEVGYSTVGVDEGWEACGKGINGSQHDAHGNPVINGKFPDMAGLVQHGHTLGLKVGWYENGCACGERHELAINYEGDVRMLASLGFDGVKLDGCGAQRNMTFYAELMRNTGKAFLVENCHWGRCTSSDDSSCPTAQWCPFNWFRTSGDINASPMSWLHNLQTTIQFQDTHTPLSRPGCWAYPDMLEVGRIRIDGQVHLGWNQAHFGAWCVVSAPLILGLDVTDRDGVSGVIDIITNEEAIAVNQQWAGHPGALVWQGQGGALGFPAARPCNAHNVGLKQSGWSLRPLSADAVALEAPGGGCLAARGGGAQGGAGGTVVVECNATDPSQVFAYDAATRQLKQASTGHCVDVHSGGPIVWMYGCTGGPNDQLFINTTEGTVSVRVGGATGLCFGLEAADPAGATVETQLQAWAKPLSADQGVAVLLINPNDSAHDIQVPLSALPLTGAGANLTASALHVRDIWQRADLPPMPAASSHVTATVPAYASAFLRLSPATA